MKVALLNTHPYLTEWINKTQPEITVFQAVDETIFEYKLILLTTSYPFEEESFHLLGLWERYLRIRFRRIKLGLIGWRPYDSANYIHISKIPTDWNAWYRNALPLRERPSYPPLVDRSVLIPIQYMLESHGERAFHNLLIDARMSIVVLESELRRNPGYKLESNSTFYKRMIKNWNQLERVWNEGKDYFSLMPHYPEILRFEEILIDWQRIKNNQFPSLRLSAKLGTYLEEVISEIVEIYQLDRPKNISIRQTNISANILIVDDEQDVYEDLNESLLAYNVFYASDFVKMKQIFQTRKIDLVFVDLNMRIGDIDSFSGLDNIRFLRQNYPSLRIVVLSSYRDIYRIAQSAKNGADDFLYKGSLDMTSPEFKSKIQNLLTQN